MAAILFLGNMIFRIEMYSFRNLMEESVKKWQKPLIFGLLTIRLLKKKTMVENNNGMDFVFKNGEFRFFLFKTALNLTKKN